jgi:hypothetical protein
MKRIKVRALQGPAAWAEWEEWAEKLSFSSSSPGSIMKQSV